MAIESGALTLFKASFNGKITVNLRCIQKLGGHLKTTRVLYQVAARVLGFARSRHADHRHLAEYRNGDHCLFEKLISIHATQLPEIRSSFLDYLRC